MTTERVAVDAKPMTINQDIERKIIEINQQVATIPEVNSDEARSIAASLVAFSTRLIADAEADYKPHLATLRKPWDDKCKELREWKVRAGTPREILEPMIINYDRKRRLIAAEEQRKADEAARRQAEADRKAEIAKLKKTEPAEAKALAKAPVVVPQLAPVMPPPEREGGPHEADMGRRARRPAGAHQGDRRGQGPRELRHLQRVQGRQLRPRHRWEDAGPGGPVLPEGRPQHQEGIGHGTHQARRAAQ